MRPTAIVLSDRQTRRPAFTLLDLLVSIGVIALLVSILFPVITHLRESAARSADLAALRQLTLSCVAYSYDHDDLLPAGRLAVLNSDADDGGGTGHPVPSGSVYSGPRDRPAAGEYGGDDYTWINYKDCWLPLTRYMPALDQIKSCSSIRSGYWGFEKFGQPRPDLGYPDDTQVGWIYWGGRDDLNISGKLAYRSMHRRGQHLTPGSQTLWTCWCWDSAGSGNASMCPHVGSRLVMYPNGVQLKPPPDGLGIALDDGSASFVQWTDMIIIPQSNAWKLYYQP